MTAPLKRKTLAGWAMVVVTLVATWGAAPARGVELTDAQIENRRCFTCHAQSSIGMLSPEERRLKVAPATQPGTRPAPVVGSPAVPAPAVRPGLYVTDETLKGSKHETLACADCHTQAKLLPHPSAMGPASCDSKCHSPENSDYQQGAHAGARAAGDVNAPTCTTCHGGHDILPKANRQSRIYPLNIVQTCANCHTKYQAQTPNGKTGKENVAQYLESVHGQAVVKGGLMVAATCADCHGPHKVLPGKDPKSSVARANVPHTCGRCHVGVSETYEKSVHGELMAGGNAEAPVCTGCHTAHQITRTDTPAFMKDIVNECGQCHDKPLKGSKSKVTLYQTYRMSYHGQVTQLGSVRGARCSDCHGAHDVRRIGDPANRLSGDGRLGVCRQCHTSATASFATFAPHANYRDAARFPLLHGIWLYFVIMMSFAFGFFGLHSLLWLVRSLIERVRHGPHPRHYHTGEHAIQRFNRVDRLNHAFVIISFFGLTLTGLPLLYADKEWGRALMAGLGGVRSAGILHRFFALMLIGNFVVHGVGIVRRIRRHGFFNLMLGPATMLPRWKDVTDCVGMFRWFFLGGRKPAFDRWTYWEKFDYVAEVGGSFIIGLTGVILWLAADKPEWLPGWLPGWVFNAATIVHGYEALLAIGFIFSIHFFNAHLRLEKFPVDDVIFTGRLPEEEFKEERHVEYARAVETGQIEAMRVRPPAAGYRRFAIVVGILAMTVGTTLVVLIILAGLGVI